MYIYIYIHTYIHIESNKDDNDNTVRSPDFGPPPSSPSQKGTNGVSTNGVTAIFMFFDRWTFWVLPLADVYLPKSARAYLFPQSVKIG